YGWMAGDDESDALGPERPRLRRKGVRRAGVRAGHARPERQQQPARRDATSRQPDHRHDPADDGGTPGASPPGLEERRTAALARHGRHRSLSVVSARSAISTARIQNRITTLFSAQPISSK